MDAGHKKQGFSLIEIVIAVGVTSFAIVAILGLMVIAYSSERASTDDTEMAIIAGRKLSELRNHSFDDILKALDDELADPVYVTDDGATTEEASADYVLRFQHAVDTASKPVDGPPNLVRVRMELSPARDANNTKVFHACIARH